MAGSLRVFATLAVIIGVAGGGPALIAAAGAQEMSAEQKAMMEKYAASMAPGPQHAEMADLAGTWTVKTTYWLMPGGEPVVNEGKAVRTMLFDGRVMREEFTGGFEGQPYLGIGYSGYDNVTGRYWGTWMDSMMTGIMMLTGEWDASKNMLVMEGDVPDPMAGGLVKMRIESRMDGKNREISDFYKPGPDGKMFRMMELDYERQ